MILKNAKEAAQGCKKYAFKNLDINKVCAIIKSDNFASMKVAESIDMSKETKFITRYYNGDMLHFLYSVCKYAYWVWYSGGIMVDWKGMMI